MTTRSWMQGPPRKILLATDLGPRSDRAFDRAVFLATEWKVPLVAVHVMEEESAQMLDAAAVPPWRRSSDPQQIAENRIRADMRELSADLTIAIATGDPAEAIINTAETHGCDLIVTGVARDEPLGRLVLGSTVDRLVRRSSVPVLVVRRRAHRPYYHVVVATDLSDSSRHALEAAVRLFPRQVMTVFNAYDAPMASLVSDSAAHRRQFEEAAERDCKAFIEASDLSAYQGPPPQIVVAYGEPDQVLHDYVKERSVDVVALGTHGRSALFRIMLGSVAERLINNLPCDVLVVREPRATAGA